MSCCIISMSVFMCVSASLNYIGSYSQKRWRCCQNFKWEMLYLVSQKTSRFVCCYCLMHELPDMNNTTITQVEKWIWIKFKLLRVTNSSLFKGNTWPCPQWCRGSSCCLTAPASLVLSSAWVSVCVEILCMLWLLWFTPTFQIHASRWIGYTQLPLGLNVCMVPY